MISIIDSKPDSAASKRASDSLGIGLAIVERVLTLHGARLVQQSSATGMVASIHFSTEGST